MEYPSLDTPTAGAFRFNTDSNQLEIYDGNQWTGVLATSPELQTGGTRGVWGGGNQHPSYKDTIDYISISSTGVAVDFGNLVNAGDRSAACASRTRGIWMGYKVPGGEADVIEYITIAQTGNATDFGDLSAARELNTALSNQTRGISAGGD